MRVAQNVALAEVSLLRGENVSGGNVADVKLI
jgi:hypothetical protein